MNLIPANSRTSTLSFKAFSSVIHKLGLDKKQRIPYRNSCLTRLLQHSLGGNCKTIFLGTIGPSFRNFRQTYSTLKFMTKTMLIKMYPTPNINSKESLIVQFLRPFGLISDTDPYELSLKNEVDISSVFK